jgi:hypothetical protein
MQRIQPTQAKPSNILGFGVAWRATKLDFRPEAINDAGMIVGAQAPLGYATSAVRWQNSGEPVQLGVSSAANCQGSAEATAISPSGIAAGTANGCVLVWTTPGVDPLVPLYAQAGVSYRVFAVYDDRTVLGQMRTNNHTYGFQVSVANGLAVSPTDFLAHAADGAGNLYGSFGGAPARWSVAHGLSMLPLPSGYASGNVEAADARGDAIGYVYNPGPVMRAEWNANGTVAVLVNLPTNLTSINAAGRFVGSAQMVLGKPDQVWTSFSGALTTLASPDSLGYSAMGVNNCGAIIGAAESGPTAGVLFTRTSLTTPVCDQPPLIQSASASAAHPVHRRELVTGDRAEVAAPLGGVATPRSTRT